MTPPSRPAIKLSETERELALAETRAVLAAAASEDYREELAELEEAIEAGLLDEEHALTLEPILELALQAGRIRGDLRPARRDRGAAPLSQAAARRRRCSRAPAR